MHNVFVLCFFSLTHIQHHILKLFASLLNTSFPRFSMYIFQKIKLATIKLLSYAFTFCVYI